VASWLTTALLLMRLVGDPSPVSLGLSYIHRRLQIGYNRAASLMSAWNWRASSARRITPESARSS
jgi:DNA segregation ATPase FtsK/SpoIIIE-like protein